MNQFYLSPELIKLRSLQAHLEKSIKPILESLRKYEELNYEFARYLECIRQEEYNSVHNKIRDVWEPLKCKMLLIKNKELENISDQHMMRILFILIISNLSYGFSEQWVDPHDMNSNAKEFLKTPSSTGNLDDGKSKWVDPLDPHDMVTNNKQNLKNSNTENPPFEKQQCSVNVEESNSLIYLKRIVNLLLKSGDLVSTIETYDELEYKGQLYITMSNEDFKFLKNFASKSNVNIEDLRKLDDVLTKSFKRSVIDNIVGVFMSTQEKMFDLFTSKNCLPLLGLCLFIYISYNLFKSNFSMWYVFRYLVLMVIMIDFVQRYQQLFKEAEEHNMNLKYSLKCDTNKMSWSEYFKFLSSNEDCEQKVVSLLEVGLNQVRSVVIIPLAAAGTGMGQFGAGLWNNLPFPWNILIFPIMLIFCAILIAIVMTTVNNTSFRFNLLHLFHLEFGDKKQEITGKTLDKLLDAMSHRPLLQDVKSAGADNSRWRKNKAKPIQSKNKEKENKDTKNDNISVEKKKKTSDPKVFKAITSEKHIDNPGNAD